MVLMEYPGHLLDVFNGENGKEVANKVVIGTKSVSGVPDTISEVLVFCLNQTTKNTFIISRSFLLNGSLEIVFVVSLVNLSHTFQERNGVRRQDGCEHFFVCAEFRFSSFVELFSY